MVMNSNRRHKFKKLSNPFPAGISIDAMIVVINSNRRHEFQSSSKINGGPDNRGY